MSLRRSFFLVGFGIGLLLIFYIAQAVSLYERASSAQEGVVTSYDRLCNLDRLSIAAIGGQRKDTLHAYLGRLTKLGLDPGQISMLRERINALPESPDEAGRAARLRLSRDIGVIAAGHEDSLAGKEE